MHPLLGSGDYLLSAPDELHSFLIEDKRLLQPHIIVV